MDSWDSKWEEVFKSQEWGKYPPEELIRFIARNYYKTPLRKNIRILDLGCGTGAASWFIAREGFSVYGIDGSKTAIDIVKERFDNENLIGEFKVGDFIKIEYPSNFFDCVVDISSLQHNNIGNLKIILSEIHRVLKPNGKLFSMMISKKSRFDKCNRFTHLFKKEEIKSLFCNFNDLCIESSKRTDRGNMFYHYITEVKK